MTGVLWVRSWDLAFHQAPRAMVTTSCYYRGLYEPTCGSFRRILPKLAGSRPPITSQGLAAAVILIIHSDYNGDCDGICGGGGFAVIGPSPRTRNTLRRELGGEKKLSHLSCPAYGRCLVRRREPRGTCNESCLTPPWLE